MAFSCLKNMCESSHKSIGLSLQMNISDYVEQAHLFTSTSSHMNATRIDHVTHMRSFVTRELFDVTMSKVKVEIACTSFVDFVSLCFYIS